MLAMAIPLLTDKVEPWREWIHECMGPRKEEFEEFNERMGLTTHRAWLERSPHGPLAVVVVDGPGAPDFLRKLAKSEKPFDTWFRKHISEYHKIDFSKPNAVQPPELLLDWYAPSYVNVSA
jgi:hypothetical protein